MNKYIDINNFLSKNWQPETFSTKYSFHLHCKTQDILILLEYTKKIIWNKLLNVYIFVSPFYRVFLSSFANGLITISDYCSQYSISKE